jgi:hypothetical protein
MVSRRAVTALFLVQLIAFAGSAQQSSEFGRATGGEVVMTPKGAARFSGSLELSLSNGNDVFGRGTSTAYGLTAGATLLQDRLWFFGAASRQQSPIARFAGLALPENATAEAVGARANGQLAGGHDFSAFFANARRPELAMTGRSPFTGITPSSFLSLRYTGIVSSNMFFNASISRSERTVQSLGIVIVP